MTLRPRRTDDPSTDDGLRVALGEANRRYSRRIHFRQGWRGYLWQGRFASVPMDEAHLPACARYVALNPVRAGLVARAEDWRWSSARAHLDGNGNGLVQLQPLKDQVCDWRAFLDAGLSEAEREAIRAGERTGRPLGSDAFLNFLEQRLGRVMARQKPGRKAWPPGGAG